MWGRCADVRTGKRAVRARVVAADLGVLRWPRRLDMLTCAALSGALMIGAQLTVTHWFYLYIPWFSPFVAFALLVPAAPLNAKSSARCASAPWPTSRCGTWRPSGT